ncbi:MAG: methyltransferase domain-containing protein [Boseongicola sp.]|nr:methyltransferase domain-containing protein [Boseongicola sp.]NNJ68608.1 methyltransferase domain-containing protein [Boseongicola sp.]
MTDTPNATERDFWSGPSGQSWVANQEEMDRQMAEVADLVLHHAQPGPGQRILDIGSGAGALSLLAAEAVGPSGHVLATDISKPLLDCADMRGRTIDHMDTFLADTQTADWPAADYDLAISRFGVMFFADPAAAFANIARALKPGGRIVFAAWAPPQDNPFWRIPTKHAVAHLGQPPKIEPNQPGPMGLADIELACDHLTNGGFDNVEGRVETIHLRHTDGATGFASLCCRIGAAKRVINHFEADEKAQQAIENDIAAEFARFERPDGTCAIPAAINLLTATKPA